MEKALESRIDRYLEGVSPYLYPASIAAGAALVIVGAALLLNPKAALRWRIIGAAALAVGGVSVFCGVYLIGS